MTPQQPQCDKLRRLLQQHLLLARRLLRLAQEQTQAILKNDTVRLAALEKQQREVIAQQESLEPARIVAVRDLARVCKLTGEPTLQTLLPAMPATERKAFAQIRDEMLNTQKELRKAKEENLRLLQNALEFVQFSMETISEIAFKPSRYGTNLVALATPALMLDSRA